MSDTCKVFDNLHMQWMWIWMCPYNITDTLIDQALGSHLEIWVTPGQQMLVKCGDWGCRPNQDWSHINVRHMQGVCQPSYAVDVHMDASLQHYSRSHWPSFGKSPRNLRMVTPGQQMMVKCSDWGCRPNQNWSHINVRHMQGVWQPSYALDVNMDVSCSHWWSFGKSPRNLGNFRATIDGEVQWLRL
jgi:hypothetical protein